MQVEQLRCGCGHVAVWPSRPLELFLVTLKIAKDPIYWDVLSNNAAPRTLAESLGFRVKRRLVRMS